MNHWDSNIKMTQFDFKNLSVTYLQRTEFQNWIAFLSCCFGSVIKDYPNGSTHFLEHRLFELDNKEATSLFSDLGADVNAFTARRLMGFYFSTLQNHFQSIQLLLDMVLKKRKFPSKAIKNEKKIIESEILMVEDDPYTRAYQQLIEQMFWEHPVRSKIAGTKESIQAINSTILTNLHSQYFNPSSCQLLLCGPDHPEHFTELFQQKISNNQWNPPKLIIPTRFDMEPVPIKSKEVDISLPITKNLLLMGIKTKKTTLTLTDSMIGELIGHILFGSISPFIDQLFKNNFIDDTFYFSFDWEIDYGYLLISSYTTKPNQLRKAIEKELVRRMVEGIDQEEFSIIKNYFLGSTYMMIDKPANLISHLANLSWLNHSWFDYINILQSLTVDLVNQELSQFIDIKQLAITLVHPL